MFKSWKYGLIKIEHSSISEEDYCEIVELYACSEHDEYAIYNTGYSSKDNRLFNTFCKARINSIDDLCTAYNDIMKDGVNTWFSENGTFSPSDDGFWNWTSFKHLDASLEGADIEGYEDELELYKVYGGD